MCKYCEEDKKLEDDIECLMYTQRVIKAVVKQDDKATKQAIKDYVLREYPNQNLRVDFLNKDTVDEIIKLGIAEYQRRKLGDSSGKKKEV